jgi:hypothetical protein
MRGTLDIRLKDTAAAALPYVSGFTSAKRFFTGMLRLLAALVWSRTPSYEGRNRRIERYERKFTRRYSRIRLEAPPNPLCRKTPRSEENLANQVDGPSPTGAFFLRIDSRSTRVAWI